MRKQESRQDGSAHMHTPRDRPRNGEPLSKQQIKEGRKRTMMWSGARGQGLVVSGRMCLSPAPTGPLSTPRLTGSHGMVVHRSFAGMDEPESQRSHA